jgi:hypothetical protein
MWLSGQEVDLVVHLVLSGALHPGQIVLTDLAFTYYQELPPIVCETYDLGRYNILHLAKKVGLKEVRPARLHARQFPAPRIPEGFVRTQKGFHDAPSIRKPVCICFCKVPTPAVRLPTCWHTCSRKEPECYDIFV